jgi:hypothetical protein
MMKFKFAILFFIVFDCANAQTKIPKNYFSIGLNQPLITTSTGEYYNDDWKFIEYASSIPTRSDFSRTHVKIGFHFTYGRKINSTDGIQLGIYIANRKINETYYSDYHNQPDGGSDDYINSQTYHYQQNQIGLSVGYNRRFTITNQISILLGANLIYFRNYNSSSHLKSNTDEYNFTESVVTKHEINFQNNWGDFNFTGLGIESSLNYDFANNIGLNIGIQNYLTYVYVNQPKIFEYNRVTEILTPVYINDSYQTKKIENTKVKALDFTNLSPFIRLVYRI